MNGCLSHGFVSYYLSFLVVIAVALVYLTRNGALSSLLQDCLCCIPGIIPGIKCCRLSFFHFRRVPSRSTLSLPLSLFLTAQCIRDYHLESPIVEGEGCRLAGFMTVNKVRGLVAFGGFGVGPPRVARTMLFYVKTTGWFRLNAQNCVPD